jgi:hypothetical protein
VQRFGVCSHNAPSGDAATEQYAGGCNTIYVQQTVVGSCDILGILSFIDSDVADEEVEGLQEGSRDVTMT